MRISTKKRTLLAALLLASGAVLSACAALGLGNVLQAPQFSVAAGRNAELRLVGPSLQSPLGGAGIRLWARVRNPNPFGMALSALEGSLALEGTRAANVNFPLGVPLLASQDTVIPLDITIRFSDLPGLANLATRLISQSSVNYQLDGTVTVDAGLLGQPKFGPSTLLTGNMVIRK
jgi:hypothetical protein